MDVPKESKMKAVHKIQLSIIDKQRVLETQNYNKWKKVEIAGRISLIFFIYRRQKGNEGVKLSYEKQIAKNKE